MATKKASTVGATDGTTKINPALEVLARPVDSLMLDERNARKHERRSIDAIKTSLATYGQQKPIVALTSGVVIAGNGTLEAARELGWDRLAVVTFDNEDEARARAFAIMDNRSAELSEWDFEELKGTVGVLPDYLSSSVGFASGEIEQMIADFSGDRAEVKPDNYSRKIDAPVYRPTGKKPEVSTLYDARKTEALTEGIKAAALPSAVESFLIHAAQRHTVFNFGLIAEFYAHSAPDVQRLMEDSVLVIVDFNKAVEDGFVTLTKALSEQFKVEGDGTDA